MAMLINIDYPFYWVNVLIQLLVQYSAARNMVVIQRYSGNDSDRVLVLATVLALSDKGGEDQDGGLTSHPSAPIDPQPFANNNYANPIITLNTLSRCSPTLVLLVIISFCHFKCRDV